MTNSRQELGSHGEQLAADFLKQDGFQIVTQNFRVRQGEIDIIACNDEYLVFCEVKTRWATEGIHPTESITRYKRQKLRQLGKIYLAQNPQSFLQPRFDVIAIQMYPNEAPVIEHFPDAF